MRLRAQRFALVLIMVIALVPAGAAGALTGRSIDGEFPLSVAPWGQTQPDIDWPYVVYKDGRSGTHNPDIRVYNMETGRDFAINPGDWEQANPSVSGMRVVYSDQRNYDETDCDVWMYDIATGKESVVCEAPNGQGNPYIYGDIVAWVDWRNSGTGNGSDIYMKNLTTGIESVVCTETTDQREPVVWENYVVWKDDRHGRDSIYMKDLTTGEETCIAEGWYASSYPFQHESFRSPHVADGVVVFSSQKYVYDSGTSSFRYDYDIELYDIESKQTTQLNTVSGQNRWHPVVSDGWVSWTDNRNDEMEVWGYDLVAEEEVQLVAHDPSDSETGWFKYAGRSTTGSGWVIWHDHRPGDGDDEKSDLYAKYLGAGTAPTQVMPLQGADRYTTAIEVSRQAFPEGADALVIATGRNWPDALAGSALAGAWGAPILLADSAMQVGGEWLLPEAIASEIERLAPNTVFILGGESAVPAPVQDAINALLGDVQLNVRRLGGIDRFETACIVASETVDALGDEWDGNAFVTTGSNFPDALAASPLAANVGYPLFLSGPEGLSEDTQACMDELSVDGAIVLGGSVAVPLSVLGQMQALGVTELDRVGGSDRYQTAARIAEYGVDEFGMSMDTLGIATGANYPDALAMGGALGQSGYVMMLTSPTYLPAATSLALDTHADDISQVRYAGGTGAITQFVRNAIAALIH